ncbi:unnamed protein product, partial [Sphacelaria rigidula]
QLLEIALQGGRPIELFPSDASLSVVVDDRMVKTFQRAFSSGLFKNDLGGAVYVGPGLLPSKLPADTTPPALLTPAAGTSAEDCWRGHEDRRAVVRIHSGVFESRSGQQAARD